MEEALETFRAYDKSGAGLITYNELAMLMQMLDPDMTEYKFKVLMQKTGAHGKDQMKFEDFASWLIGEKGIPTVIKVEAPEDRQGADVAEVHAANLAQVQTCNYDFNAVIPRVVQAGTSFKRKGISVLVTGGAGYIGSHACLSLLEHGYDVTVIDNLSRGHLGAVHAVAEFGKSMCGTYQFIEGDLGNKLLLEAIFRNHHFDAVIHFAAVAFVGESMADPLLYYQNVTTNTANLLGAMQLVGVSRLIYSSSCATYGNPDQVPITEETPQVPVNPYGASKYMSERVIIDWLRAHKVLKGKETRVALLRYFNVIGSDPKGRVGEVPKISGADKNARLSGACFDAAMGKIPQMTVYGTDWPTKDGTTVRDYIHVTDLIDAHVRTLASLMSKPYDDAALGNPQIYNVATGKGNSVREFLHAVMKATGKAFKVVDKPRRPGDYAEIFASPAKIEQKLGWTAKYTDLEESLRTAWCWRQAHPKGYADS